MSTLQQQTAAFAEQYAQRPIPAEGPIDTRPIDATPDTDEYDAIWQHVIPETRARGNDFHLPLSAPYARRLCDAYPQADRELVLVATLLHDTGWAHVDEDRIISEGFRGDWRKADIRFEHEAQGCVVAKRVLPTLGYSDEFIAKINAIIDGHDTRQEAHSIEDALMRDADRSWRFDRVGIALASGWFGQTPDYYTDRLGYEIIDPAPNTAWGSVPVGNKDDVNAAVEAAHAAFTTGPWSKTTPAERAETLLRIADEIEARATELSLTNTLENGSPVAETSGAAANAASIFRYFATLAPKLKADDIRAFPSGVGESLVRKEPIGVCALIAPWNFPINLMVTKLAPALLAGCTVVMKPASPTPLSFRIIVDVVTAAGVPAGVVNYVTGPGRIGDLMVRHLKVAKVAFTGSTPVGRHIAAACGELLRPVTLELGGKSSVIVLEDADLNEMSAGLIRSCLRNTGQTCYISPRILAPASRCDEVVDMVTQTIADAPQGDPLHPSTVFGPSASHSQYQSVREHLESAKQEGARITTGGAPAQLHGKLADGLFIQPTVLADITPDMRVAREEIFGPVITIIKYTDMGDAISLANNTEFGLGGIVFGNDQEKALEVADTMNTGSVGLNFFASNHAAPFGGRNDSGLGVEYGPEGLAAYLAYKSIHRR